MDKFYAYVETMIISLYRIYDMWMYLHYIIR